MDSGATLRAVHSLALTSASALAKGGKKSIGIVRKASEMLRDLLLDVEPQTEDGLSPEEEEALLERLSQMPDGANSVDSEPRTIRIGPLARLTLIGGPGLGTEFEVEAVPFTLESRPELGPSRLARAAPRAPWAPAPADSSLRAPRADSRLQRAIPMETLRRATPAPSC